MKKRLLSLFLCIFLISRPTVFALPYTSLYQTQDPNELLGKAVGELLYHSLKNVTWDRHIFGRAWNHTKANIVKTVGTAAVIGGASYGLYHLVQSDKQSRASADRLRSLKFRDWHNDMEGFIYFQNPSSSIKDYITNIDRVWFEFDKAMRFTYYPDEKTVHAAFAAYRDNPSSTTKMQLREALRIAPWTLSTDVLSLLDKLPNLKYIPPLRLENNDLNVKESLIARYHQRYNQIKSGPGPYYEYDKKLSPAGVFFTYGDLMSMNLEKYARSHLHVDVNKYRNALQHARENESTFSPQDRQGRIFLLEFRVHSLQKAKEYFGDAVDKLSHLSVRCDHPTPSSSSYAGSNARSGTSSSGSHSGSNARSGTSSSGSHSGSNARRDTSSGRAHAAPKAGSAFPSGAGRVTPHQALTRRLSMLSSDLKNTTFHFRSSDPKHLMPGEKAVMKPSELPELLDTSAKDPKALGSIKQFAAYAPILFIYFFGDATFITGSGFSIKGHESAADKAKIEYKVIQAAFIDSDKLANGQLYRRVKASISEQRFISGNLYYEKDKGLQKFLQDMGTLSALFGLVDKKMNE